LDSGWPDWAIVYFGRFFKLQKCSPCFQSSFFLGLWYAVIMTKRRLATFWAIFFRSSSGHPGRIQCLVRIQFQEGFGIPCLVVSSRDKGIPKNMLQEMPRFHAYLVAILCNENATYWKACPGSTKNLTGWTWLSDWMYS
jgi:hypothetical protein